MSERAKWAAATAAAVAVGGAGMRVAAARKRAGWPTRPPHRPPEPHWHTITVDAPPQRLAPGGAALAELADLSGLIELRVQPAPGGKGTELAARLRAGEHPHPLRRLRGTDPVQQLRGAMRRVKQVAETGEVLMADASGAPDRSPRRMPASALDRFGRVEGRL
jgi:hypothetical protein